MAETIAVLSLKGGTGKTTTVRTLSDVLRRVGLDVLAIDLDPQGNLSDYFDVPPDASPTIADVLSGDAKAKAAVHDGIVPASPILAEVERSLSGKMGRELVLRKALKDARKQHDVVLIDCPPALGLLTINGLVAADWALISSEAQYFALQGVQGALDVIEQAKEFYNPDLEWLGVVMNIADMRTVHSREAYSQLQEHYGDKVFETDHPLLDRVRRVGRARPLDPRSPARPRRGLPRAGRRGPRPHRAAGRAAGAEAATGELTLRPTRSRRAPGAGGLRWLDGSGAAAGGGHQHRGRRSPSTSWSSRRAEQAAPRPVHSPPACVRRTPMRGSPGGRRVGPDRAADRVRLAARARL